MFCGLKFQNGEPLSFAIQASKMDEMTYVYMVGNEKRWFGVARTATKPENMQGFHEDNMLFIVDEASGVARSDHGGCSWYLVRREQ